MAPSNIEKEKAYRDLKDVKGKDAWRECELIEASSNNWPMDQQIRAPCEISTKLPLHLPVSRVDLTNRFD